MVNDFDRRAVGQLLAMIGEQELSSNLFDIIDMEDRFPVERANHLLNEKSGSLICKGTARAVPFLLKRSWHVF